MTRGSRPRIALALALSLALLTLGPASLIHAEDGPLPPEKAAQALHTPDDLKVEQVLAEPAVRQPVFLNFDERGRMWVVQYLQYPAPAGLTMLSRDAYYRAVYDKVPQAPPHHVPGRDTISIFEDTDGDGRFESQKTFVDNLNIATAVERGRGGVWVLNPPYLLFYPDLDGDDMPDGDPIVHLEGFGLEDTHSVVNSLCWGPDGWLYAAQGSTVTAHVHKPGDPTPPVASMGQLIWRYHPETRRYEVFAEGGGNAFGVEIDARGRIFSGHNGGDTRGFHYVQGGYYQKGFAKHGPLSNPNAFGYFPAMPHDKVPRFTHTFVVDDGGVLPAKYAGKLFGVAPLLNHVVISEFLPMGASVKTHDVGFAITSDDKWFRPVDIKLGPDGCIYVADWYDGQVTHTRNYEGKIDASNGRIYRIEPATGRPSLAPFDLAALSTDELIDHLSHPNRWHRRTALRILGDRRDRSAIPRLRKMAREESGPLALESLWALNLCGGLDDASTLALIDHAYPDVRAWAIRLACDDGRVSADIASALAARAATEPDVTVRAQLASSARRLPASSSLAIVRNLLARDEDATDPFVPLLVWWAVEAHADDRDAAFGLLRSPESWSHPIVGEVVAPRLMRRYAAHGTRVDLDACADLFALAPDAASRRRLAEGFEAALTGRTLPALPDALAEALATYGGRSLALGLRRGDPEAAARAVALLTDPKGDHDEQLAAVGVLGEIAVPAALPALLDLATGSPDEALRGAALAALSRYDDPKIAPRVLASIPNLSAELRPDALGLLATRRAWAKTLLEAIDAGAIDAKAVPPDAAARLRRLANDESLAPLVARHFGKGTAASPAEIQARIDRFADIVASGGGSPKAGKALFAESCGKCHTLFAIGGKVGPDLTSYKRDDLAAMLLGIVNPSAEIREGYEPRLIATTDGRALSGIVVDEDPNVLVLRGADGRDTAVPRTEIDEMAPGTASIMPEGLLDTLSESQLRDLFAYLRSSQPNID